MLARAGFPPGTKLVLQKTNTTATTGNTEYNHERLDGRPWWKGRLRGLSRRGRPGVSVVVAPDAPTVSLGRLDNDSRQGSRASSVLLTS